MPWRRGLSRCLHDWLQGLLKFSGYLLCLQIALPQLEVFIVHPAKGFPARQVTKHIKHANHL